MAAGVIPTMATGGAGGIPDRITGGVGSNPHPASFGPVAKCKRPAINRGGQLLNVGRCSYSHTAEFSIWLRRYMTTTIGEK
jgi:hypothetical protein